MSLPDKTQKIVYSHLEYDLARRQELENSGNGMAVELKLADASCCIFTMG